MFAGRANAFPQQQRIPVRSSNEHVFAAATNTKKKELRNDKSPDKNNEVLYKNEILE